MIKDCYITASAISLFYRQNMGKKFNLAELQCSWCSQSKQMLRDELSKQTNARSPALSTNFALLRHSGKACCGAERAEC